MTRRPNQPPVVEAEYYYRRDLQPSDLLPALGIAVGVGIAGFYIARLLLQRTTLGPPSRPTASLPTSPAMIYRRRGRTRPDGG